MKSSASQDVLVPNDTPRSKAPKLIQLCQQLSKPIPIKQTKYDDEDAIDPADVARYEWASWRMYHRIANARIASARRYYNSNQVQTSSEERVIKANCDLISQASFTELGCPHENDSSQNEKQNDCCTGSRPIPLEDSFEGVFVFELSD